MTLNFSTGHVKLIWIRSDTYTYLHCSSILHFFYFKFFIPQLKNITIVSVFKYNNTNLCVPEQVKICKEEQTIFCTIYMYIQVHTTPFTCGLWIVLILFCVFVSTNDCVTLRCFHSIICFYSHARFFLCSCDKSHYSSDNNTCY